MCAAAEALVALALAEDLMYIPRAHALLAGIRIINWLLAVAKKCQSESALFGKHVSTMGRTHVRVSKEWRGRRLDIARRRPQTIVLYTEPAIR